MPPAFAPVTLALTAVLNCEGCTSSHYLRPPQPASEETGPRKGQPASASHKRLEETVDLSWPESEPIFRRRLSLTRKSSS